jgi:hypothetical protein
MQLGNILSSFGAKRFADMLESEIGQLRVGGA